ncbi:MAG: hypothetical protein J0H40_06065 [Rhizobiales bacterium]|nr:hypothetical protein [Hyphomicrobiales bacterium]
MTIHSNFVFRSAIDRFVVWRKHRRDLRELADLGEVDFSAIARDLCISPGDLETVVKNGTGRAANLGLLLGLLGIDGAETLRTEPAVVRDMERVCAGCPSIAKCSEDLHAGVSRWTYRKYCANSITIDALRRR